MVNHSNRGRLAVDLNGKWRLYSNTLPAGSEAIGTVTKGGTDTGALVRIAATGLYVQVNAGAIKTLPQTKVVAAIAAAQEG